MVAYCGWDPTTPVVNETTVLDGDGTRQLWLPSLYVTAVASVTITDPDGSTYDAVMGEGNDVTWNQNGRLLWEGWQYFGLVDPSQRFLAWPYGAANVSVVWSGGYTTIPADLAAALNSLSNRMPYITGALSRRLGQVQISYPQAIANGGLLWIEECVFRKYKIMRVG